MTDKDVLVDLLNELFEYKDGHLVRKKGVPGKGSIKGSIAGSIVGDGYINVCINQKKHRAHRLIWLMFHGSMPSDGEEIDHINGVRSDNRIENLRIVSRSENSRNQQIRSNNKSGVTGVCFNSGRGKWEAYIKHDGKKINLGLHAEKDDAILARKEAEKKYGYHRNHGRSPIDNVSITKLKLSARS